MHVYTLLPLTVLTWVCVVVLVRNFQTTTTSIQFNINSQKNTLENYNFDPQKGGKIKKYHVPKFMLDLYERNKVEKSNESRPDVVRSLIPKHAEVVEELSENHLLVFDLPKPEDGEEFVSAELRILTLVEINSDFGVEKQLKMSVYDDTKKIFYNLQEMHIYHLNNTWLSFNVTRAVVRILQKSNSEKLLKIIISVSAFLPHYEDSNKFKLSLMPMREDFEHDYPILLLSYSSNHEKTAKNRKKRSLEEDYEEETNKIWDNEASKTLQVKKPKKIKNSCKRRPLYINFAEINFDMWIVQPTGYEAYQCQGKCFYPVADHLNPTKHAIMQALLHSVAPSKVSRSCCVPTHLDSISILYVDNNGILTYRYAYKDMVVVDCGCR